MHNPVVGDELVQVWGTKDGGRGSDRRRSPWEVLGRDSIYVLVGFPVAIVSFVVVVTGLSLSIGLAPIWLGFPVAVGTLLAARLFASIERGRLDARGAGTVEAVYRPPTDTDSWTRRAFSVLRDPQSWLDALHAVFILPISTITFSVVVAWWATGLGGIAYWIWGGALPDDDDNETLAELLNLDVSDSLFYAGLGVAALATLIPVVWACASVQATVGRVLLGNRHVAALEPALGRPDGAADEFVPVERGTLAPPTIDEAAKVDEAAADDAD